MGLGHEPRRVPRPAPGCSNPNRIVNIRSTSRAQISILLLAAFTVPVLHAEPFLPKDGNQRLETLRSTASSIPFTTKSWALRARLNADPTNLTLACQFARRCIERSLERKRAPALLGMRQSALSPWWAADLPIDALVLRATIKQSQHDFTNALADLDLAAHQHPCNAQVWLDSRVNSNGPRKLRGSAKGMLPLAQLTPDSSL